LAIIGATLALGRPGNEPGLIIGRFYEEAIKTGIAQITRGALEAFVPYGWVVNATLDVIATPINLFAGDAPVSFACEECMNGGDRNGNHVRPHIDADYPLPLAFMYLV
jgi:hypothetical protein